MAPVIEFRIKKHPYLTKEDRVSRYYSLNDMNGSQNLPERLKNSYLSSFSVQTQYSATNIAFETILKAPKPNSNLYHIRGEETSPYRILTNTWKKQQIEKLRSHHEIAVKAIEKILKSTQRRPNSNATRKVRFSEVFPKFKKPHDTSTTYPPTRINKKPTAYEVKRRDSSTNTH